MVRVGVDFSHFVGMPTGSHISLNANYWLNTALFSLFIKLHCARERAVISQCYRAHAEFFNAVKHLRYLLQTIEQAVMAVVMEMDKFNRRSCHRTRLFAHVFPHFCIYFSTTNPIPDGVLGTTIPLNQLPLRPPQLVPSYGK